MRCSADQLVAGVLRRVDRLVELRVDGLPDLKYGGDDPDAKEEAPGLIRMDESCLVKATSMAPLGSVVR